MHYDERQMMDIVVESGSVSTECPPWFGDDLAIDDEQTVQLVDIQRQPTKSYVKRNILLFI